MRTTSPRSPAGEKSLALPLPTPSLHGVFVRECIIALTAFLTVVDLFATQAILPSLVRHYQVSPAAMGFAVNASTMGMAVSGLLVALFSRRIDRRLGILVSLALLAIPTALLAVAPGLGTFTLLRIVQGLYSSTSPGPSSCTSRCTGPSR
jgi:predicted MFS family arabinose efflux permease